MKQIIQKLKEIYRGMTMQKKLVLSFSVPLILLSITITLLCSRTLTSAYASQARYTMYQSGEQVNYYVTQSLENMYYLSQLVSQSQELQEILKERSRMPFKDLAEEYREFYNLNLLFNTLEMSNVGYHLGLYVDDDLSYSKNEYYFYPLSQLTERADYDEIKSAINQNGRCLVIMNEIRTSGGAAVETEYLELLSTVTIDQNTYITKVGMELNQIKKVLGTARSFEEQAVYLYDDHGKFIAASKGARFGKEPDRLLVNEGELDEWNQLDLDDKKYYGVYRQSDKYGWKILTLISKADFENQTSLVWKQMLLLTVFLMVAIIVVSYYLARYYVRRLENVNAHMKSLENGDLNTQMNDQRYTEGKGDEIDAIYAGFNSMSARLQKLMKNHYQLGKKVMSAELRALQAQINPHFLYNTLDMINWGALEHGADEVASMARNLGIFYRLSLNHGRSAIKIEDELRHVETYLNIESVHFPGAISLNMDIDPEVKNYACLNIILQPFVENAIVHGIAEFPDIIETNISISAHMENDGQDILFTIEDDGPGIPKEKLDEILVDNPSAPSGYGVKNTNFRIKLCYGEKYGVSYESEEMEGTRVFIRIPAMTYEELSELLK